MHVLLLCGRCSQSTTWCQWNWKGHICCLCVFLALIMLNLLSLWVDSGNNRRIILLSLSLYGHFMYMQQLFFVLPHNGDTAPDLCKTIAFIWIMFSDLLLILYILYMLLLSHEKKPIILWCLIVKCKYLFELYQAISAGCE